MSRYNILVKIGLFEILLGSKVNAGRFTEHVEVGGQMQVGQTWYRAVLIFSTQMIGPLVYTQVFSWCGYM